MKYQLVLQWPAADVNDLDDMIRMENILINRLPQDCLVDGHDIGSGEMNNFTFTNNPTTAFEAAKSALETEALWPLVRVAYRDRERAEYTVLWPNDLHHFSVS